MGITDFLLRYKEKVLQRMLAAYVKKRKKNKKPFSLQKIRTVLVLAVLPENIETKFFVKQKQQEIAACLSLNKQNIKILLYTKTPVKNAVNDDLDFACAFDKNSFNWLGAAKNKALKRILQMPYDLLVSYNFEDNLYLKFCQRAATQTHFFVGAAQSPNFLYDLSIVLPNSDSAIFNQEMKKYLTIFKKL